MNKKNCCEKCLGSYGFGKDNWGCIEKGCPCHQAPEGKEKCKEWQENGNWFDNHRWREIENNTRI